MPQNSQHAFAAALLDPDAPPPEGVIGPGGRPAGKRFNVYRNNVTVSLMESLAAAYPMVERLVGEGFFKAMARAFVRAEPPRSPLMVLYGEGFPDFIQGFEPARKLPYLADVARVDRAWLRAYHAADAEPAPQAFAALPQDRLPEARLTLHPTAQILTLATPGLSIWRHAQAQSRERLALKPGGEAALVLRPAMTVELHALLPGGGAFLSALQQDAPLGEAAAAGAEASDAFDFAAQLTLILQSGALVGAKIKKG